MRHKYLLFIIGLTFSIIKSQTIDSPSEFLGYELGSRFHRHHQILDYFKYVANVLPQKVKMEKYGESYEKRPLYITYVSSEENIQNLETIRENHLKNAGLLSDAANPDIAIVWLSYNVHGNEASSSEASMQTLYKLITENQDWLKNTLVIIDPCLNPDGRDRYVNWYNETANILYDVDPQASEHNEPWPSGRPNHYLFDLNRDWAWATQIETSSRLKVYNKWLPHIHVDFHEQGYNEPYYFAPAARPFHEIITNFQKQFQTEIGENHARYFDDNGWLFFTRERFDLFYPSYGDTYPTYSGAIGMTYEQAGHGKAGLGILTDEGGILTLKDRLTHHTITGLSTVEIASKNAQRLNKEFSKFFDNSDLKYKSYVLSGNEDKISKLITLLDKHEIKYGYANTQKVTGYNYSTRKKGSLTLKGNALVVNTDQPKGKMVKALFEPNAKLSDSLTYDITAWSLPYAYGLDAVASTSKVSTKQYTAPIFSQTLPDAYGYVSHWNTLKDAKFLVELIKNDFKVRFTEKPFKSNGNSFKQGSLIITKGDNKHKKDFKLTLTNIANEYKQKLTLINSGFSETIPDIGSPDIKLINKQKVAILSGKNIASLSYGSLWHFFEQQLQYPVTSINTNNLKNIDLKKYSILILPDGKYENLLDEKIREKLKKWVTSGGKIIAFQNALKSFLDIENFKLKTKKDKGISKEDSLKEKLVSYASRDRKSLKNLITGAIFKVHLDNSHPLAFGYNKSYFTLKLGAANYEFIEKGYNVGYLNEPTVYSGFAGKKALKKLESTLVFGEERIGKGSVIYMVDNPLFRGFWESGKLLMANAIFFVNSDAYGKGNFK